MTTDRVYRKKLGVEDAIAEIRDQSGRQFDPELVSCLLEGGRSGGVHDLLSTATPSLHELIDRIR